MVVEMKKGFISSPEGNHLSQSSKGVKLIVVITLLEEDEK